MECLYYIALVLYSLIICFLYTGIRKNLRTLKKIGKSADMAVSVVLSVKNEEKYISRCLDALLNQDYPKELFEIIVVDDHSTDRTESILQHYKKHGNIRLIRANDHRYKSGKKSALTAGIKQANSELLLLTDADCVPSNSWMRSIVQLYNQHIVLVAGFSPQQAAHAPLWNGFLLIDSLAAAFVAAGTIGWQRGVTCTGRNLSFRMPVFKQVGEYEHLPDSVSGDDDFVLQRISRNKCGKILYALEVKSQVQSNGPGNFSKFLEQKTRHISAGKFFGFWQKVFFAAFHLLNYFLWSALFTVFLSPLHALFLLVKILTDFIFMRAFANSLQRKINVAHFLLWEVLFPIYNAVSAPLAVRKKINWKMN